MKPPDLRELHADLGHRPIVAGTISGNNPVYVERYIYQTADLAVSGLKRTVLAMQFGAGRINEIEHMHWPSLPTRAILVRRNTPTRWQYSGTADFVLFHFLDEQCGTAEQLANLVSARGEPISFLDPLVSAAATQLVNELQLGAGADEGFMARLADVMLEQAFRALTMQTTRGINPRHVHFSRLQAVLNYVQQHLNENLSVDTLAKHAAVSIAHFRRIFQEAMGVAPHRYILGLRLEHARKLLSASSMPISRVAEECGFGSQSHFTACFRDTYAVTPAAFRAQMRC